MTFLPTTEAFVQIGCERSRHCKFRLDCPNGFRAYSFDYSRYNRWKDWSHYAMIAVLIVLVLLFAASALLIVSAQASIVFFLLKYSNPQHFSYSGSMLVTGALDAIFVTGYFLWGRIGTLAVHGSFYAIFAIAWLMIGFIIICRKAIESLPSVVRFGLLRFQGDETSAR